jgi:hypothetical protein
MKQNGFFYSLQIPSPGEFLFLKSYMLKIAGLCRDETDLFVYVMAI